LIITHQLGALKVNSAAGSARDLSPEGALLLAETINYESPLFLAGILQQLAGFKTYPIIIGG